jgi:hypothetical protein
MAVTRTFCKKKDQTDPKHLYIDNLFVYISKHPEITSNRSSKTTIILSKYIKIRKYDLLWLLLFSHIIKNAYIVIAIKNTYERKMNERKMTDILRMKEKWLIFYSLACMHIFFILLIKRLTFKWLYTIISDITYILWSRNKCQSKLKLEI